MTRRQQPRREENIDPDGEPSAGSSSDITVYMPAPLVPLKDVDLAKVKLGDPVSDAILAQLSDDSLPALRVTSEERSAILAYYKARDYIPAWVGVRGLNQRARDMLSVMASADEEGLNAQDYLPASLSSFGDDGTRLVTSPKALARLDLEVTAAALKYARHARSGRIEPNKITRFNDLKPPKLAPEEMLAELNQAKQPGSYLASLHPTTAAYQALKAELHRLRASEAAVASLPQLEPGSVITLGMRDERVPNLRIRLASLGLLDSHITITEASAPADGPSTNLTHEDDVAIDRLSTIRPDPIEAGGAAGSGRGSLAGVVVASADANAAPVGPTGTPPVDPMLYDQEVMDGIKAFQKREGLKPDGIVGKRTVAAFNSTSHAAKIQKLLLNMERARWLPRELGDRYVLVNQPAFEVSVVEDGAEIHRARVVIGTQTNQTPAFSDVMETIEFNPYWYVPRSIVANEMLPRLRRDPGYLTRSGYEVLNTRSRVVNSASIDWRKYSERTPVASVRQPPGRANALGEMKFLFPNSHAVYLHDTPSKGLFSRAERDFSHGCVRVQDPRRLAEVLLSRDGWTAEQIAKAIATGKNNGVRLKHRVDVHLVYMTAWPDSDGSIRYYNDIYGRDAKLAKAMQGGLVSLQ
ncbi:L,D-transpeptidase family protein [Rhodoligotrophos defluvii]|uniref:L,D-transpeptidase family protein n=1 Tax=Rhodoligotrophos defluvii TaxID=2561934 RepID=UPI0010C959E2|nr:L,D-transpeptidase family protein [Rhodoligotrophos defluvii]